jgi:hypothetical protein
MKANKTLLALLGAALVVGGALFLAPTYAYPTASTPPGAQGSSGLGVYCPFYYYNGTGYNGTGVQGGVNGSYPLCLGYGPMGYQYLNQTGGQFGPMSWMWGWMGRGSGEGAQPSGWFGGMMGGYGPGSRNGSGGGGCGRTR